MLIKSKNHLYGGFLYYVYGKFNYNKRILVLTMRIYYNISENIVYKKTFNWKGSAFMSEVVLN